ncbi:MAG: YeeE/YedE thiosulfate transporter family protein, partial [Gemmatimonadota bacterium]
MNAPLHVFGAFGSAGSVVAALVIGLAFGWFLERGGLGNARKLAGQFYLTDLTVFKVLFTGVVTAMVGVFWLARLGVLEPRLLDAPPTFLAPVLVGGGVFGVGFLLGGLCPGTSCVSASSGRIDGMLVMVGMFLGVLTFMELHPLLEAFHNSTERGVFTFPALLGLRPGLVVGGVTGAALLAFAASERIDGAPRPSRARKPLLVGAVVLALGSALPWGVDAPW